MNSVPCFIREEVSGKANGIKIILAIKRLKKSTIKQQGSISFESNCQNQLQVKCSRLRDFPTIFTKKTYGEYSNYKRNPNAFNKTSKSKDISSQVQTILSGKKMGTHPHSIEKIRKRYSLDPPGRRLKTQEGVSIRQAYRGRVEYCNQSIKQIRFEKFKERLRKLKEKGSLSTQPGVKSGRERESFHSQHKFQKYNAGQVSHKSSVLITAGCDLHIKPNKAQFTSFSSLKRRLQIGRMTKRQGSQIPEDQDRLSGWENLQWGRQKHTFFDESGQPI